MPLRAQTPSEMLAEYEKERKVFVEKALKGEYKCGAWRYNPKNLTLEIDSKVSGYSKDNPYYVDLERCNNSDNILDWLLHTLEKGWCPKEQVGYLLQAISELADLYSVLGNKHFDMGKHLSQMRLEGDPKLFQVEAVAKRLRISKLSVYRMVNDEKLKAIRLPLGRSKKGEIRISENELDKLLGKE